MKPVIIKNQTQIAGIRKSCKLAAQTIEYIKPYIQPGVSTGELDLMMEKYIHDNGAKCAPKNYGFSATQPGFPKSTCISVNEVVCHGIPDSYVLKEGDIVCVDVTTILNGFYGDTAATFPVGTVSEEASALIEVAKKCLELGISVVKPGLRTGVIGSKIYSYAILNGFSVVNQYCGHGVGIYFHEEPSICHVAKETDGVSMVPGMIFTIEPMINCGVSECYVDPNDKWTVRTQDGKLSAQFEHTILITSSGCEVLTLSN